MRFAAMPDERPHDVHLSMAGCPIAAGTMDFFQHRDSRRDRKSGAPIFLWNETRKVAAFGKRDDKFLRVSGLAIEPAPVFAGKVRTELLYG